MNQRLPINQSRRGSTLVLAIMILTGLSILALGFLTSAVASGQREEREQTEQGLQNRAQNVMALAVHDLWGNFQRTYVDRRRSHWDFKFYLEGLGITNQAGVVDVARTDLRGELNLDTSVPGEFRFEGSRVDSVDVWRVDGTTHAQLFFEVTLSTPRPALGAQTASTTATTRQVFRVEGLAWDGLDYALLANNLNCVMCHTQVDDADRFYSANGLLGDFERVKVGSIESIWFREDPMSWIAGTLYLKGKALQSNGTPFTEWHDLGLKSRNFGLGGYLEQDEWGDLLESNLTPADAGDPSPMANLYLDYGSEDGEQVDGYMPDVFPPPFPDDGGFDFASGKSGDGADNRVVDPEEFEAATVLAKGSLSGGAMSVHDPSSPPITKASALDDFIAGNESALGSVTKGNVYLQGTESDPILLNGEIAIDGDLILSGYVKGAGSILVSGNIYMPSDVIYSDGTAADGKRTFGIDSTGQQNVLALASGGNVIVGDIFRSSWGSDGDVSGYKNGGFNFILEELALFNRMEWLKTQPSLPGKRIRTKTGTYTKEVKKWKYETYTYEKKVNVYKKIDGYKVKVGTKWVTKTGKKKVGKPWYKTVTRNKYAYTTPSYENPYYKGEDYLARYYGFTEGSQVPVANKRGYFDPDTSNWVADERVSKWDTCRMTIADPKKSSDKILFDRDGDPKAVVSTLTATSSWLSNDLLKRLMKDGLDARDTSKPFEVDATIYSNNSIFGILPARGSKGTDGRLLVNGAIVAADVGLLSPTSFQLNYDERGGSLLDIRADTEVQIRRQAQLPTVRP